MKQTQRMILALLVIGLAGCVTREVPPPQTSHGAVLVVERFLQAANANDLVTMMELFGTADKTIDQLDGRAQAERRMYVLASLLRHDDFSIIGQEALAGRMRTAAELQVRLKKGDQFVVVPHIVVRKKTGGWIVERVDVEAVTSRSGNR